SSVPSTLVFYETPHRIAESLRDALEILGEREAAVARELTKLHEEIARGCLSELINRFRAAETEPRGEMVVVIDREVIERSETKGQSARIGSIVSELEATGVDPRSALKRAAKQLGISRDEAYRQLTAERARQKR